MTHFLPQTPQVVQSLVTLGVIRNIFRMTANTTGEAEQCSTDSQRTSRAREKRKLLSMGAVHNTPPPEIGKTHVMLMKLSCVTKRGVSKHRNVLRGHVERLEHCL